MSDMNLEELNIIAGFLQTIQGQGIQVLLELATTKSVHAPIRLNAALALTGMYDQFMADLVEAHADVPSYEERVEKDDLPPEAGFDPDPFLDYPKDEPVSSFDEETLAQMQALGVDPSSAMQPATEQTLRELEEKYARQQVGDQTGETGDESLGGASGIGPRNPKASRRRRKHGRR